MLINKAISNNGTGSYIQSIFDLKVNIIRLYVIQCYLMV